MATPVQAKILLLDIGMVGAICCPDAPANLLARTAEGTVCPISFVKDVLVSLTTRLSP